MRYYVHYLYWYKHGGKDEDNSPKNVDNELWIRATFL